MPAPKGNKYGKNGGRPKKELCDGWQEKTLKLMKNGASKIEVMACLDISRTVYERLLGENEEFNTTIKKGEILAQSWWEKHGRVNITDKNFNSTLWYMNMKNRYSWQDKSEIKFEGDLNAEVIIR